MNILRAVADHIGLYHPECNAVRVYDVRYCTVIVPFCKVFLSVSLGVRLCVQKHNGLWNIEIDNGLKPTPIDKFETVFYWTRKKCAFNVIYLRWYIWQWPPSPSKRKT